MLVLVSVLLLLPSLPAPGQGATTTVTSRLDCPANVLVVVVDNPGQVTFQVDVSVAGQGTVATATVGPASTAEIPVALAGLPDPVDLVVTGDNGFPLTSLPVFHCPTRSDLTVTTTQSTAVEVSLPGPCDPTTAAAHGTIEPTEFMGTFLYTPAPAFVGEDSFDYECTPSAGAFGTVTVIVTAVPSPQPRGQRLPATG